MKAQASFEQMIVIAVALAFIAASFFIAANYSADSTRISQAEDAVQRLAAGADHVYALGPNSKEYVTVYLPEDMVGINASGKRILMTLRTSSGGTTDVFAYTKGELVSALSSYRGKQKILIEYLSSGKVSLGEAGLACSPSLLTKVLDAGATGSDTITIINYADYNVTGITANVTGFTSLVSATQPPSTINEGQNGTFAVDYSIPSNQTGGTYGAIVNVNSGNDGSCIAQITMQVNANYSCAALCASQGYSNGNCRGSPSLCISNGEDYKPEFDYSCGVGMPPSCCCFPTGDLWGPLVTYMSSFPPNATSSVAVAITAVCNDTSTGGSYISGAEVQLDGSAFNPMNAVDGQFNTSVAEWANRTMGQLIAGQHIAGVRCTDTANNVGPVAYYYFNITGSDAVGPIVTSMNHSDPYPTTLANITEFATATEIYTGNSDIQSCFMKVDNGNWIPAAPSDGSFDSPTEDFYYNIGQLPTGTHAVYAYCTDSIGNVGGIYNDTFGVASADVMLVIDRSGSMTEPVTYVYSNNVVSTTSSSFTLVKSITVTAKNGNLSNVSAEIRASSGGCTVAFEARVGSAVIGSGTRTSSSYGTITNLTNVANYTVPYTVDLYLKQTYPGPCTAYNRNFRLQQLPTKMDAAKVAAKTFVDVVSNSTQLGVVSYSTSATTDRTLMMMGSAANKTTIKNTIDALVASGNTCIECGIDNGRYELTSSRGRYPEAVRVEIMLTDGQGNVGDSIQGATDARYANVTIYTIGFGDDVDTDELTNIALLTGGKYYYAPDTATLTCIYQHIGQTTPC